MGWTCTKKAGDTLDKINQACYIQTKYTNQYTHKGSTYLLEESHETQKDGGIAGKITKTNACGYLVGESSFRIDGNGRIIRGIGLNDLIKEKKTPEKGKLITLQIYKYKNKIVYVDPKNKHPDPLKKLLWGWDKSGTTISDYKGMFSRQKKDIKIQMPPYPKGMTARREKEFRIKVIKTYIGQG